MKLLSKAQGHVALRVGVVENKHSGKQVHKQVQKQSQEKKKKMPIEKSRCAMGNYRH